MATFRETDCLNVGGPYCQYPSWRPQLRIRWALIKLLSERASHTTSSPVKARRG